MAYNFATAGYHKFIQPSPGIDGDALRAAVLQRLEAFTPQSWYDSPIVTLLKGEELWTSDNAQVETVDAFNQKNGKQVLASKSTVDKVLDHIRHFKAPSTDLRGPIRRIEDKFFRGELAADLVAGQALDFHKQDGFTEIEEGCQALLIERQLNDALYADEQAGKVAIGRAAAFVGCVSNFTNFLDLCRKILRNMELGVPVVVLSRSNTTQHMFRYVVQLLKLMKDEGVDTGLCTYCSCSIDDQRRILTACADSPMYFTGSRAVASRIKEVAPKLVASTGGPNTMVVGPGCFNEEVAQATRISNLIEHKGQCTALRHLVLPQATEDDIRQVYSDTPTLASGGAAESMRRKECAALLKDLAKPLAPGYSELKLPTGGSVAFRLSPKPPVEIDEQWREAYLDVTAPAAMNAQFMADLASWLNREQPISLAMNCDPQVAQELFETTGLVVYTVGNVGDHAPALTAQARPQEGECFGEFPPRRMLEAVTAFPVIIPSSTPGYNSSYTPAFLKAYGAEPVQQWGGITSTIEHLPALLQLCTSDEERGYSRVVLDYLLDATTGPRRGCGARTSLFGLQRPPLHAGESCLRLEKGATFNEALRYIVPFIATTAKSELVISVDTAAAIPETEILARHGVKVVRASSHEFASAQAVYWNVISLPRRAGAPECTPRHPLAAQFISTLFPMGHIKSTLSNHEAFLKQFGASKKWLRMAAPSGKL